MGGGAPAPPQACHDRRGAAGAPPRRYLNDLRGSGSVVGPGFDLLDFDHLETGDKKLPTWLLIFLLAASLVGTFMCLVFWEEIVAFFGGGDELGTPVEVVLS